MTQGPRWATLPVGVGMVPLVLPAEAATTIPAFTISRNLRSLSVQGVLPPEMEKLTAFTSPCSRTLLMPAVMLAPGQLLVGQTLYMRMLAHGAMPWICWEGGGTALTGTTLPPEVLDVCDPWPLESFGLGPLQRPVPSVVAQSN